MGCLQGDSSAHFVGSPCSHSTGRALAIQVKGFGKRAAINSFQHCPVCWEASQLAAHHPLLSVP